MERNYLRVTLSILLPILVTGMVFFNSSPDNSKIFMNGELSIKHSELEDDCTACHVPWSGVSNKSCFQCHNRTMHYLKKINEDSAKRTRCFDCHREHRGRLHNLKDVENTDL